MRKALGRSMARVTCATTRSSGRSPGGSSTHQSPPQADTRRSCPVPATRALGRGERCNTLGSSASEPSRRR
ncbi:MAG: hypothetical protein IPN17_07915 [Deltaproteobacteria bacterium]|nr:hypothetical protein [Deltaproteobacteria bacterium]